MSTGEGFLIGLQKEKKFALKMVFYYIFILLYIIVLISHAKILLIITKTLQITQNIYSIPSFSQPSATI